MVYVSPAAHVFYLGYESMVDRGIVPVDFPSITRYHPFHLLYPPPGPRNQQDCGLHASKAGRISAFAENVPRAFREL